MRQIIRHCCVGVVALATVVPGMAQKDRNYYTQIVNLKDSTKVRLLPDDIERINVINADAWEQMTAGDYVRFCQQGVDSAAHHGVAFAAFNESQNLTYNVPNNEAWTSALQAMAPYYKAGLGVIVGPNVNRMSRTTDTNTITRTDIDQTTAMRQHLLTLVNRQAPDAGDIATSQKVLNGQVNVISRVGKETWLRQLTLNNWSERLKSTTTHIATGDVSSFAFDGLLVTGASLFGMPVQTIDGTTFAVFTPSSNYSKPEVVTELPRPLSTTYDFYAVIVPENETYANAEDAKPGMLNFQLIYGDGKGSALQTYNFSSKYLETGSQADMNPRTQNKSTCFYNDTAKVDTLYIGRFTFPVAYDWFEDTDRTAPCPAMRISSPVSTFNKTEMATYTTTLRLAAIIMRPVEQEDNQQ